MIQTLTRSLILTIILSINSFSFELVTIGTGGLKGTYYPTGANICFLLNKNRNWSDLRCNAISTGGSVYNIKSIMATKFSFGIAQNDTVYQAYNGIGKFEGKPQKDLRAIMTIYSEPLTLVVTKKSGIKSLAGMQGKRINIGNEGSGTRVIVDLLFDKSSLNKATLKSVSQLKTKAAIKALENGEIDGYFTATGHPNSGIKLLALKTPIDIVNITPNNFSTLDSLLDEFPYFTLTTIPEGLYTGIKNEKETFGVKATLITRKNIPDHQVTMILHSIFDRFELFKDRHPAYSSITKQTVLEGLGIPSHKAAKSYLMHLK